MTEPVDVSKKHFYISMVKSVVRFIASCCLGVAGYNLWTGEMMYTDFFIAEVGFLMMLSGIGLFLAEVLGVVEEL